MLPISLLTAPNVTECIYSCYLWPAHNIDHNTDTRKCRFTLISLLHESIEMLHITMHLCSTRIQWTNWPPPSSLVLTYQNARVHRSYSHKSQHVHTVQSSTRFCLSTSRLPIISPRIRNTFHSLHQNSELRSSVVSLPKTTQWLCVRYQSTPSVSVASAQFGLDRVFSWQTVLRSYRL